MFFTTSSQHVVAWQFLACTGQCLDHRTDLRSTQQMLRDQCCPFDSCNFRTQQLVATCTCSTSSCQCGFYISSSYLRCVRQQLSRASHTRAGEANCTSVPLLSTFNLPPGSRQYLFVCLRRGQQKLPPSCHSTPLRSARSLMAYYPLVLPPPPQGKQLWPPCLLEGNIPAG